MTDQDHIRISLNCREPGSVRADLVEAQTIIVATLRTFGLDVSPGSIDHGPTFTRFEIHPGPGLRPNQVKALEADLALALRAKSIRILAPLPGKSSICIEIENAEREFIPLARLLEYPEFRDGSKQIPLAIGQGTESALVADLTTLPHLLVAGATGSGKSMGIDAMIGGILCRFKPDELRFVMIDPKGGELTIYQGLPHLARSVVTDPGEGPAALHDVATEMDQRYHLFAQLGVASLVELNLRSRSAGAIVRESRRDHSMGEQSGRNRRHHRTKQLQASVETESCVVPARLPYLVVLINDLAALIMADPTRIKESMNRLCASGPGTGIHLIAALLCPHNDQITRHIKARIPARMVFRVATTQDSRSVLNEPGAETLFGKGDLIFRAHSSAVGNRLQAPWVPDHDVRRIVDFWTHQTGPSLLPPVMGTLSDPPTLSTDAGTWLRWDDAAWHCIPAANGPDGRRPVVRASDREIEVAPAPEPAAGTSRNSRPDSTIPTNRVPTPRRSDYVASDFANSLGLELACLEPGRFKMGSTGSEEGRESEPWMGKETLHEVTISQPFWMAKVPLTERLWEELMGTTVEEQQKKPNSHGALTATGPDHPVCFVNWMEALAACDQLTMRDRADGWLPEGYAYTLPTEAQWEYACRAGTETPFNVAVPALEWLGWYCENSGSTTQPIGRKLPNAWELRDMHGNVWEWCADRFQQDPGSLLETDPVGPQIGKLHVVRGGCFSDPARRCRSSCRFGAEPQLRCNNAGFRPVLAPASQRKALLSRKLGNPKY